MSTGSYTAIINDVNKQLGAFGQSSPDVMKAFGEMTRAATKANVLDEKTKELIALAIGVALRCDGCIGFHTKALVQLGTSKEELNEMLNVALYMGGGPSLMYATHALAAFDEFQAAS